MCHEGALLVASFDGDITSYFPTHCAGMRLFGNENGFVDVSIVRG